MMAVELNSERNNMIMLQKGFWCLLEEMAPSYLGSKKLAWTAEFRTIEAYLRDSEFSPSLARHAELVLDLASQSVYDAWNFSFPWKITKQPNGRYRFLPK